MKNKTGRIALYGMCVALAFILGYIESLFPFTVAVPGMKLGLTNLVVVFALYNMNARAAFVINLVRIILVSATFGNAVSLLYSLAGGMLSFLVMLLLKKTGWFHLLSVSVAGSVFHNVGQIAVAMCLLQTKQVGWYLGVLCISGVVAGVVIGLLTGLVLTKLPKEMWKLWDDSE